MVTSVLARLGRAAVDLVFPPRCALCGRGGPFLCVECSSSLPRALPPRCRRCWRPVPAGEPCPDCRSRASALDSVRSAFLYQGPARNLVHALKYDGQTALAEPMTALMEAELREQSAGIDLVVPVPLFAWRRRTRGYNQSALLAREIGKLLAVPVAENALRRLRNTPPQVRIASAGERRSNVRGAFACQDARVAGRSILLVDDVTTTGATLEACAAPLKAAGASCVGALTFARED
jgi:ComF family protein